MNVAEKIAKLHRDRDMQIVTHLVVQINEKMNDPEWLLNSSNYSRSDENEIRYKFDLVAMMRGFIRKEERQWPSCQARSMIFDRYTEEGFIVFIDGSENLTLKVVCNDVAVESNETDPE